MKDCIGQEMSVGALVLHMSGTRGCAGSCIYHVTKLTEKRATVRATAGGHSRSLAPDHLVVVTSNLARLEAG